MILDKKLTVDRVAARIVEEYEDFLNIIFSDENAQNLVLRIRWGRGGGMCLEERGCYQRILEGREKGGMGGV